MCGIAGFLDRSYHADAEACRRLAQTMGATLHHRGPDDAGVWVDGDAGVALAHRRLAIIDLSAAGHQPMPSSCGGYVIAYNGEIYNAPELRRELMEQGRTFRGHSDTEVIVEGCAVWGVRETVRRLIGMFAFALWNNQDRTLTLARDRLGIKPLYWAKFGELSHRVSQVKLVYVQPGLLRFRRCLRSRARRCIMGFGTKPPIVHSVLATQ